MLSREYSLYSKAAQPRWTGWIEIEVAMLSCPDAVIDMTLFVGRERELSEFAQLLKKRESSLVVCQGRRRIGKSTLVHQVGKKAKHFLAFNGLAPRPGMTRQAQLDAFSQQLAQQTRLPKVALDSWPQAFQLLASQLESTGSTLLLLDEISWMAAGDPDFAGHLKNAWDQYFSRRTGLLMVLCGSVSSWIQRNILSSTGFVGRCSWQFSLKPLSINECNAFWRSRKHKVASREKLAVLAVTGGVPRYLEEIQPSQTAEQNIERLCFNPGGMLFNEFEQIFHDIFSRRAAAYRDIAHTLVSGPRTLSEISNKLGRVKGGSLGEALADLEMAGFISRDTAFDPTTGKSRRRSSRYRLSDNYVRFYLKYIEALRPQIIKGLYQRTPLETLSAWDTIIGLQFENLVLQSIQPVLRALGLGNVPVINIGPYWHARTARRRACQVDVMLRTRRALYLFEVKFRDKIGTSVMDEMQRKLARLRLPSSLSVRTGLIYEGELHPDIETSDHFEFLLPFGDLLGVD